LRGGEFSEMPAAVDADLRRLLKRGIERLYTHQADAFEQIQAGRHVVVVTPTASGKTLCYNLPVLNLLLRDEGARAMYLFPTKALAEDQLHEFQGTVEEMGSEIREFTYDGDRRQEAPAPSGLAPMSCSPIPTCCTAGSCRITRAGHGTSRICAIS
jgi:DEAD/DEAH box helicase domain-containing protein